jgi:transcription-repair coupling factor (superfamily II helicase)
MPRTSANSIILLFCLCTKVLLMKKTKLPATRITRFFERYHKFNIKTAIRKTEYYFKRIDNVVCWDYVTHRSRNRTLWRFAKNTGREQNTGSYKTGYADNDIVYVSIHSLHKISKYTGKDGHRKIYKLGSNAWKVLKQKTKARVKNIAFNLIQLYAKRRY